MKNILTLLAITLTTCAFSQGYRYEKVEHLNIKQLSEKFSNEDILTNAEKKAVKSCITKAGFKFTKDNYYECLKSSMTQKQARTLMALHPIVNSSKDHATGAMTKKEALRATEEIHPKK